MASLSIEIAAGSVEALPVPATTVDTGVVSADVYLYGWSFRESTGAAVAAAELKSGDRVLGEISLAAGGERTVWFGPMGICSLGGITLHVIAGSIVGTVYAGYSTP